MKTMNIIRLALSNIAQRRGRFILIGFGVSISIGTMVLLVSLGGGFQKKLTDSLKSSINSQAIEVIAIKDGASDQENPQPDDFRDIENTELEKIKKINGVAAVYKEIYLQGEAVSDSTKINILLVSTPKVVIDRTQAELVGGKSFTSDNAEEIILTTKTLSTLGLSQEQAIGKVLVFRTSTIDQTQRPDAGQTEPRLSYGKPTKFVIVGIKKSELASDNQGIIPQTIAEDVAKSNNYSNDSDSPSSVKVFTEGGDSIENVIDEINAMGLKTFTQEDLLASINKTFLFIKIVLASFASIAIIVSLFGISSFMIISVYERMKEIGILRALGMPRIDITKMFLIESIMIGLGGAALGIFWAIISGKIVAFAINRSLVGISQSLSDFNYQPYLDIWLIVLAFTIAALTSVLASIYPAYFASKQNLAEVMRNE